MKHNSTFVDLWYQAQDLS